jgi:hypothetical protein
MKDNLMTSTTIYANVNFQALGRQFSTKEIEQIVKLVKQCNHTGTYEKIDLRSYTSNVKSFLNVANWTEKVNGVNRFRKYLHIDVVHSIPAEVLWQLISPMIPENGESIGYSITKHILWWDVNIWNKGRDLRFHKERDMVEMIAILHRLHTYGYIDFQMAGSLWDIRRTEAYITEKGDSFDV